MRARARAPYAHEEFIVVFSDVSQYAHVHPRMHTYIRRISIRKVVRSTLIRPTWEWVNL